MKSKGFVLVTVLVAVLLAFTLVMLLASHTVDFALKRKQTATGIENRLVAEMALDAVSEWFSAKSGELIAEEDYEARTPKENPVIDLPSNFFAPIRACYPGKTITAEVTDCYYDDTYAETARKTVTPQIEPVTYDGEVTISFHIYVTVTDTDGNAVNAIGMMKSTMDKATKSKRTYKAESYFL